MEPDPTLPVPADAVLDRATGSSAAVDPAVIAAEERAEELAAAAPTPWWGWAMVASWVGLVVAANVGTIVSPSLQKRSPEALLALSSRNRHLLMAIGNDITPSAYAVVATLRITLAAFVCYGLGRAFGPKAIHWFRNVTGMPRASLDNLERGFAAASWVLIPFFVGSNIVAMLAGQLPVPLRRYVVLLAGGIAARLVLFWVLAEQLRGPLDAFVRFTTRFQWPLMIALGVWVVGSNALRLRRRG
jgi:membrane protein DedA with SNARE-associated domain